MVMEKKRLQYLDEIKGFAIILMVLAHAIAWSFEDWRAVMNPVVSTPNLVNAGLIWKFIYSFHMALFFLVSGYLCFKPLNDLGGAFLGLKKKSIRLLIPYFVTGGLVTLIRPGFGYWFLFSLWELSVIGLAIIYLLEKINKTNKLWIDIIVIVIGCFLVEKTRSIELLTNPVANVRYGLSFYLPFMSGVFIRKHPVVEIFLSKLYSLIVISFTVCFVTRYIEVDLPVAERILGWIKTIISLTHATELLGSLTFYYMFKQGINKKAGEILSYLGKHTFEIYVIHIFFVVRISQVGAFWLETNLPTCLATQIVYSTCATAIAVVISLIISGFIKHSKVLSKLLFGQ